MSPLSFFNRISLQKKISFFVLLGLAIALGLFAWVGLRAAGDSTDRTLEERLGNAQLVANFVDSILLHIVQDTREVALLKGISDAEQVEFRTRYLRQDFEEIGVHVHELFLLNELGDTVWESSPQLMQGRFPRLEFAGGLSTSLRTGYYISDALNFSVEGRPVVMVASLLPDQEQGKQLILGAIVDLSPLSTQWFLKPWSLGNTGYAEIVDGKGTVLARSFPGRPPRSEEISDHPGKFSDLIREGKAVVRTCHRCHGGETEPPKRRDIIAFAPLSMTSWGVALRQTEEEAFGPVRSLQNQLLIFAALLALACLIPIAFMSRSVVTPIKDLTQASRRIAGGNLEGAITSRSGDEIGELSRTFDLMRIRLRDTQKELERWNRELEERVGKRTAELSYQLEIAKMLGSTLELETLLKNVMSKLGGLLGPVGGEAYLLLHNPGRKGLVVQTTAGQTADYAELEPPFKKMAEEAFLSGKVQYNLSIDPSPALSDFKDKKTAACIAVPVQSSNRATGVLLVIARQELALVGAQEIHLAEATAQQMGLALENAWLRGQVEEMAILQERDRIAREIHDGLAQTLAFLNLQFTTVKELLAEGETEKAKAELNKMVRATADAYDEVRATIVGLDSEARLAQRVSETGFLPVVRQLAGQFTEQSGIPAELSLPRDGVVQMPLRVQVQLVRVVQEALNNIRKHAVASKASIQLEEQEGQLVLRVTDDGRGFSPDSPSAEKHLGLGIMKSRVESLNGNFRIESTPGSGTRILVSLPLDSVRVPIA
ncbi:MAG: HAMP domain-containing protein [Chloroflexi bacterium]|nr:HAMP domain-containing protein [Chloroflexota bacterium]